MKVTLVAVEVMANIQGSSTSVVKYFRKKKKQR